MNQCIELHIIQQFAPSCLNRDDTNTPKDCTFGGVRRARISSQCLKRSAREWFRANNAPVVGDRTKYLRRLLEKRFPDRDEKARTSVLDAFISTYYGEMKGEKTAVLHFISPDELDAAATEITKVWDEYLTAINAFQASSNSDDKKKNKKTRVEITPDKQIVAKLKEASLSADIALFGRMLAEQAGRNIEAATQVAHALSTHRVDMEMDFYTAVDDQNTAEETGAGMMGYTGFNSACFYRYALVDRQQLLENLKDESLTDQVIEAFLRASVFAIPTGKQHSMAAQNMPSFGFFVVREKGAPLSLANAFTKPVSPGREDDLIGASVAALSQHWEAVQRVYGKQGVTCTALFQVQQEKYLGELAKADCGSVDAAIARTMEAMRCAV